MDRAEAHPDASGGFDDSAVRAVALAEREARSFGHDRVGTEHVLLGVLTCGDETSNLLHGAGVTLAAARHKVSEAVGERSAGVVDPTRPLPRSARAARALGRAARFAHAGGSDVVASGHVLWGLLDVEGTAGQVLRGLGVEVDSLQRELLDTLPGHASAVRHPMAPMAAHGADAPHGRVPAATCPSCTLDVDGGLAARVVAAIAESGASHDAIVYSCTNCGRVLGVAPA